MKHLQSSALRKLCLVIAAGGALHAQAALIELDYLNPGDKLLTQDTVTGRKWLDLSYTQNWSLSRATTELPNFTVATTDSVLELYRNAGINFSGYCTPGCTINDQYPVVLSLLQKVSAITYSLNGDGQSQGLSIDPRGLYGYSNVSLAAFNYGTEISSGTGTEVRFDQTADTHGVWLFIGGVEQGGTGGAAGVPGPIPILGGVAVLLWSRKIRKKLLEKKPSDRDVVA